MSSFSYGPFSISLASRLRIQESYCPLVFMAADTSGQTSAQPSIGATRFAESLLDNIGPLLISAIAVLLAYYAIRANVSVNKQRLEFEKRKFRADEAERKKLATFRDQEYQKLSQPAADLAEHLARHLREDPHWARQALEAAKLIEYSDTLFGERSQHFKEEKEELAKRFTPYLMERCKALIGDGQRHVYLLIDSGTTLYPFFRLIGMETAKCWQRGEEWLKYFHLATNNLPGLEELMRSGRRVQFDRYSKLAIEGCHLLPGVPMPVFSAVAGEETKKAIRLLHDKASTREAPESPLFIGLLVGNWVRIRNRIPRCPVPMARGVEHKEVKDTLVENSDEVYVVSPLGKIFIGQSNDAVNRALGFSPNPADPEKDRYDDVTIDDRKAQRVKLVSTCREESRILHRHSFRLEDALVPPDRTHSAMIDEENFATAKIDELPHLLFPFSQLPNNKYQELEVEFPHYTTRTREEFLKMFDVRMPGERA